LSDRAGVVERPRELGPGITLFPAKTPTLPPATHTNSYALGERDVLLVEPATPYDDERRAWLEWARGLAAQGRRLIAIFCTHHHSDHVGGASFLAGELGLPLWAHALTAERAPDVAISRRLEDGETIVLDGPTPQRWQVLHTPGHAPGHACLHLGERGELVVGDMVASVGTILIEPSDGNMRVYLEQLQRLEALAAVRALPAHGEPIAEPSKLFAHYIAHRLMRENKVFDALAAHGQNGATDVELVPSAYDDTSRALWPIALLSLRAHLIKLVDEGRVRRDEQRFFLS
jgi:glyoxylase-like metal-dependent hydrolase (beta-lactamase superfamily II)